MKLGLGLANKKKKIKRRSTTLLSIWWQSWTGLQTLMDSITIEYSGCEWSLVTCFVHITRYVSYMPSASIGGSLIPLILHTLALMSDWLVYVQIIVHPLPVPILHNLQTICLWCYSHQVIPCGGVRKANTSMVEELQNLHACMLKCYSSVASLREVDCN